MSTIMKSSARNKEIDFDVFDYTKKKRNFNNNKHNHHLRDQLNKFISEYFLQSTKDEENKSFALSSLMENKNIDKILVLENQILQEEKSIMELEKSKKQKLVKVLLLNKFIF